MNANPLLTVPQKHVLMLIRLWEEGKIARPLYPALPDMTLRGFVGGSTILNGHVLMICWPYKLAK